MTKKCQWGWGGGCDEPAAPNVTPGRGVYNAPGLHCVKHKALVHERSNRTREDLRRLSVLRHQTVPVYTQQWRAEGIYGEAEKYLNSSLAKWRKHLPQLCEDAFQEGMIQVWRDLEAGVDGGDTTKLKILRRAGLAAEKFLHRNGEYAFGKPKKSREGISRNTATREKIEVFLEEYLPIHNWVYPSAQVVADSVGLNRANVTQHLKNIREGRGDHMVYREDGRMDWDYYSSMSVELLNREGDSAEGNRAWTDNPQVASLQEVFEDDLVGNLDLANILNQLNDTHREILYYYLYEGYTPTDVARMQGKDTNPNAKGARTLKAALSQVRMLIAPYEGQCSKGHDRTPETSEVIKRIDGIYIRICKVCRTANGGLKEPKAPGKRMGRPRSDKCSKGHTKDRTDSGGYKRCSICRAENQRNYTKRKREGS